LLRRQLGRRLEGRVFIRYYLELDRPCEMVATLLPSEGPGGWLVAIIQESARWEGELMRRAGLGPPHRWGERRDGIAVGPPVPFGGGLLVPLSWRSAGHRALFPVVEADLQIAPMGHELPKSIPYLRRVASALSALDGPSWDLSAVAWRSTSRCVALEVRVTSLATTSTARSYAPKS